jgi:hypothetical protein
VGVDEALTLAHDEDVGQVTLSGLPVGAAGGASLTPVEGVELSFDCADGRLCDVVVDTEQPGEAATVRPSALAFVSRLLGADADAALRQPGRLNGSRIVTATPRDVLAALSRLARLDAARLTSPVAQSPLWTVEAAQLAARAQLRARATAETRRAADLVKRASGSAARMLAAATPAVADLVEDTEPWLAKRLREHVTTGRGRSAAPAAPAPRADAPSAGRDKADCGLSSAGLQWWLDPRLVPPMLFRYGTWPGSELKVQPAAANIVVELQLVPGADRQELRGCQARVVVPASRTVAASAPLHEVAESFVRAELPRPETDAEVWVEVVDDQNRPVLSGRLHRIRRAMRWADAALSAARQPAWLSDVEQASLATQAWERCAQDWSAAGDADRAYLAAARRNLLSPVFTAPVLADVGAAGQAEAVSDWARQVADRPPLTEPAFLAETVSC